MRQSIFIPAVLLCAAVTAFGQNPPQPQHGDGRPDRPRPGMSGPWDNDVLVYRIPAEGPAAKLATFERAGVPTLARMKDGRLIAAHQHFPKDNEAGFDKVAVRFSEDEGKSWTSPEVIRLQGLPDDLRFPFDPTLVPLPDGRVRLYFTSVCERRPEQGTPAIYSAISTNGRNFTFEPQMRFGIEGRIVIDCAVVLHHGTFHLFVPDNGPQPQPGRRLEQASDRPRNGVAYHATSVDGLKFTRVEDVRIGGRRHWLGCAQSEGKVITFFGAGEPGGPGALADGHQASGMWTATSHDGQAWELGHGIFVMGADPGVVAGRDGGWIVVATGPPRSGTPSDRRNQQRRPPPAPER